MTNRILLDQQSQAKFQNRIHRTIYLYFERMQMVIICIRKYLVFFYKYKSNKNKVLNTKESTYGLWNCVILTEAIGCSK